MDNKIFEYEDKQLNYFLQQANIVEIFNSMEFDKTIIVNLIAVKGKRRIKYCYFKFYYNLYLAQWEYKYYEELELKHYGRYEKTEQLIKKLQRLANKQEKIDPLNNFKITFTNIF